MWMSTQSHSLIRDDHLHVFVGVGAAVLLNLMYDDRAESCGVMLMQWRSAKSVQDSGIV